MSSTFGYWKVRGTGQTIRLLLKYVEEDFKERRYILGPEAGESLPDDFTVAQWPDNRGEYGKDWFDEKYNKGLDFPNIPYYKDDKVNITHQLTIFRYLARKYGLGAKTDEENVRLDLISSECRDFFGEIGMAIYSGLLLGSQEQKDGMRGTLQKRLQQFEDFLGDRPWMVGTYITWADFYAYEVMDWHRRFWPVCFKDFPKLTAFMDRFEALPQIKAYMASDQFIAEPLIAPFAPIGGRPGQCGPLE